MDRHYYYRQLGLTCDASTSQVKKAYEERMAKLNSADYADDPEYRRKKKEEATSAYKALIGSAPLSFGGQGSTPFEKIKAALDREDDFDDCDTCVDVEDKPSFKGRFERNKSRSSGRETIGRVASGAIAAKILKELGISVEEKKLTLDKDSFMNADLQQVKKLFNETNSFGYFVSARTGIIEDAIDNVARKNKIDIEAVKKENN